MEEQGIGPMMWVGSMDAFLSSWFTSYDDARVALDADGGFLFPYADQFFVPVDDAIHELGLSPDDPDWKLIGRDWVRPADPEAWQRLRVKREVAG